MSAALEHAIARARVVAEDTADKYADEVDSLGRFPHEAVAALKEQRLLGCGVSTEFGGDGVSLVDLCEIARILGRHCAATGMIFAMHQTQILSLSRHCAGAGIETFLRAAVEEQLLLASATTEMGIGGDVRRSSCAVEQSAQQITLVKQAPVISYGQYADAILVTARRNPESAASDQVLVVCRRDDVTLRQIGEWNTLGMRGTCSPGFLLTATTTPDMVVAEDYSEISARTMLPVSHSVWSAVWLGIADGALAKARRYVRAAARKDPGSTPSGALRLAEAAAIQQQFADLVMASAGRFDAAANSPVGSAEADALTSVGVSLAMNNLKVSASELVVDVVAKALLVCGISGYREDGEYSLGRNLRDAYGAALMVNNDRIMANSAQMAVVYSGTV